MKLWTVLSSFLSFYNFCCPFFYWPFMNIAFFIIISLFRYLLAVLRIRDVYPGSRFPDPDFCPSRIQKQQQKRGVKKNCFPIFLEPIKVTKLKIILILNCWKKNLGANLQRIIELSTQKIVIKLSKIQYGFGISDPGVKKAPDPGSGSATLLARSFCIFLPLLWILYHLCQPVSFFVDPCDWSVFLIVFQIFFPQQNEKPETRRGRACSSCCIVY